MRVLLRPLLALALACTACRREERPPAPPPPGPAPVKQAEPTSAEAKRWTWVARSHDGRASVAQTWLGPGRCRVEGSGGARPWSVEECRGDAYSFQFVSPDGLRLMVLTPLPETGASWKTATVVELYEAEKRVAALAAGAFVHVEARLARFSTHFAWLEGTGGLRGEPPVLAGAFVDGTTADGRALHLGFDGSGVPMPVVEAPPAPPASTAAECDGVMRWTDDEGTPHYTNSLAEVPGRSRKTITCTAGEEVGVVPAAIHAPAPSAHEAREEEPPPPPRPSNQPASTKKVHCIFKYFQGLNWMQYGYCTSGDVSEATAKCDADATAKHPGHSPCYCSDDPTWISTRCD